ncbi:LBP / BPI / CETP family C-terminal domain protein [Acanthocheilonema viteae]|uniref:Lipid-binding serum glycoprotein C-terminal domain-containing protein n=1 Tax=Acanthocheilonema viteae TaxID=6277 RepID=A0A498S7Q6_ACAVI|nr:unnamed protein product [Acanthocheilonema viteae]
MNVLISTFLAILSLCPVLSNSVLQQNSPGRPLTSFSECDVSNTETLKEVHSANFNPILRSYGHVGYPGFKIRFNRNAFRYGSSMIAQMLNQEIWNVRIPSFSQSLPEVNGCAYLTNILITNYQCARNIGLFPISHNEIALNIQNFDLSLSGQLGGQVVVLLPLPLCGTLCIDAQQISISLQIAIERNPYNGAAYIRMTKCFLTIGYLNIHIINGGLIGEIINNNFRNKIISQAYATIPEKFCNMIPPLIDKNVNSRLADIPQKISITQLISYASFLVNERKKLPEYCYSDICRRYYSNNMSLKFSTKAIFTDGVPNTAGPEKEKIDSNKPSAKSERLLNNTLPDTVTLQEKIGQKSSVPVEIIKKFPQKIQKIHKNGNWQRTKRNIGSVNVNNNVWQQCSNCDYGKNEIISHYADNIIKHIQTCASNLALSIYLLDSSATNSDLTFNLLGEFSPNAQGGTPFAPPLLQYPIPDSGKMFDLLISDYTFNTLLYHLHRKGIFTFRIGPEIPVVGDLLNLTCSTNDVDFELSLELQDNKDVSDNMTLNETNSQHDRKKRRTTIDTFLNFGICLGDIAPEIREKNPGKRVYIIIKTNRAPSVQFKAANGGTIIVEFIIDGLIFLDGTTTRVGHIQLTTVSAITAQLRDNRIVGKAEIQRMKFIDVDQTFGLPKEAFANLSDLARGIITRAINKKLAYGIPITMSQLGLPIQLQNTDLQLIEHALFISTDANIPSLAHRLPYQRFAGCPYYN